MKKKKKVFVFCGKGIEGKEGVGLFKEKLAQYFFETDNIGEAESIIVLGGDGAMLSAVRHYYQYKLPFVGFNFGTEGFLLNEPKESILSEIVQDQIQAVSSRLLEAEIFDLKGENSKKIFAFNDFYFSQAGKGSCHLKIWINDELQFAKFGYLSGDGVIVCTPAGSTAYSASAGGGILTVGTNSLIMTGICPQIKHRWHTAILPDSDTITIEPIDTEYRRVNFLFDGHFVIGVKKAVIKYSDKVVELIFAKSQDYAKKVKDLQFGR